jgi:hypothetical protein
MAVVAPVGKVGRGLQARACRFTHHFQVRMIPRSERMVQLFAKGGVPLFATADLMVAKKFNSLGMDQRAEMLFSSSSHLG